VSRYVRRLAELPEQRVTAYGDDFRLWNVVRPDSGGSSELSINAIQMPATTGTPYHLHRNCEEAWIIQSGSGRLRVNDEIHEFGAGDVLHVPKGVPHQLVPTGDEALRYIAITVPAVDLENDNIVLEPFEPFEPADG
jgi:mannose-6-phosphate isomerase-like protein (cupin superfamily)